jgi:hypothetical protein
MRNDFSESLERIVAWGCSRASTGRWRSAGPERLYAARLLQWSLALEVSGNPGGCWDDYSHCGIGGPEGEELVQIVFSKLCSNHVLRLDGDRYSTGNAPEKSHVAFIEELWGWLNGETPDGYPPEW